MLHVFGRAQLDSWRSGQRELKVRGNFSHRFTVKPPPPTSTVGACTVQLTLRATCDCLLLLLQLQLPSFAAVEADVCWSPKNNSDFNYQAKGKLRVQRQECRVGDSALFTYRQFNLVPKVILASFRFLCSSTDLQEKSDCILP